LRQDPQVKAIIEQAQNERRQQREDELVQRVKDAITQFALRGEKASLHKVSLVVGMDRTLLRAHTRVEELFFASP